MSHRGRMWQAFGLGLWAGYGLAIPVGAVAVLLIHRSATATLRQGLAAVLGAVAADALYAVAALLGGAAAARLIAPWQSAVTVAGAGVLLVLAARIAIDGLTRDPADPERGTAGGGPKCGDGQPPRTAPGRAWREALLFFSLTALNPWPLLYFVSVVAVSLKKKAGTASEAVALLTGIILASASWHCVLVLIGRSAGKALLSGSGRRITAMVSAAVIAGLALRLLAPG